MKTTLIIILSWMGAILGCAAQSHLQSHCGISVFERQNAQYRIPSVLETKRGKIIAFTDHRYHNKDIGGGRHLDIVMKSSTDGGMTWDAEEQMVAQGGSGIAGDFHCAHGDAATVVDRETGEILLLCASGGIGYWESTRDKPLMMGRYYSNDEGKTWQGEEITNEIYALMPEVNAAFFSSGRICQSQKIKNGSHYRLYTVLCTLQGNRVLYSDDFGKRWNVLGDNAADAAPKGDEAKVEELPDGNVLLSSRISGGRLFNIFRYDHLKELAAKRSKNASVASNGKWDEAVLSYEDNHGVAAKDNACNGEVLIVKAKDAHNKQVTLLLQSVPLGPQRTNVAIYYKPLHSSADYATPTAIATNWEGCYQVSYTTSAYSTMVQAKNGDLLFLMEEDAYRNPETEPDDYYNIRFDRINIKELTNNQYR